MLKSLLATLNGPFFKDDFLKLTALLGAHFLDFRGAHLTMNFHLFLDPILAQSDGLSHLENLLVSHQVNARH